MKVFGIGTTSTRTVDEILSNFNGMIEELGAIAVDCSAQVAVNNETITSLEEANATLESERGRANTVAERLRALVG